jgi:hypothetical protein
LLGQLQTFGSHHVGRYEVNKPVRPDGFVKKSPNGLKNRPKWRPITFKNKTNSKRILLNDILHATFFTNEYISLIILLYYFG